MVPNPCGIRLHRHLREGAELLGSPGLFHVVLFAPMLTPPVVTDQVGADQLVLDGRQDLSGCRA